MARGSGECNQAKASSRGSQRAASVWTATLAYTVDAVHLADERWDTEAIAAGLAPAAFMTLQGERWQALLAAARICVRVESELLPMILADGRVKSQFETGTSNAHLGAYRAIAEADVFGYQTDLPAPLRPVYGYLDDTQGRNSVQHYGDAKLILAEAARERTSVIACDSLSSHTLWCRDDRFTAQAVPEPIDEASHRSLLRPLPAGAALREVADAHPRPFVDGYVEAHVHGGLGVDLVDAVQFDRPDRVPAETLVALREQGIRCLDQDGNDMPVWLGGKPSTPGLVTLDTLDVGDRSIPLRYSPSLDREASTHPGQVELGPAFYDLKPEQRRGVIAHELGHTFDDALLTTQPQLFDEAPWADADGVLLNGPESNCTERIADAYAALCGPGWQADLARWPVIRQVGVYALANGYPLHPGAAAELATG